MHGLHTYRIGHELTGKPAKNAPLRLACVRFLPRGVKKSDWPTLFDAWLPLLAPEAELVRAARAGQDDDKAWQRFATRYRAAMTGSTQTAQALRLLALTSQRTGIALGCYCENEHRCHRSLLKTLVEEAGRS